MTEGPHRRVGRPPASSREAIEREAIALFLIHGYGQTTVAMIAAASDVSRTTFFRYYSSKAEIIWSAFDAHTHHLHALLAADPGERAGRTTMVVVREQVVEALRAPIDPGGLWMRRFQVLDSSVELRSEESAHWVSWAMTIAAYVAGRLGVEPGAVVPQSIGGALQAAFLAVLRSWRGVPGASEELLPYLDEALRTLCEVLQKWIDGLHAA